MGVLYQCLASHMLCELFPIHGMMLFKTTKQLISMTLKNHRHFQLSRKRKDRMKLSLLPKLVEKLVWVPVISLCVKIFISYYAKTGCSRPLIA
jgi:hypothetical protein